MTELNYFNCTLGEAAGLPAEQKAQWGTIPELLKFRAQRSGTKVAVAFASGDGSPDQWKPKAYTFRELANEVKNAALVVGLSLQKYDGPVALLASSTIEFLFVWLGLVHLGLPVLLIAPEVPVAGVANLLRETGSLVLLHDDKHEKVAAQAVEALAAQPAEYKATPIPSREGQSTWMDPCPYHSATPNSVAYIHHTSGTSTGLPKPIPITHRGAVGVLPFFEDDWATFTTTPLYHGGPADCFRSWAAGAAIWLFPGQRDVPITANTVLSAVNLSKSSPAMPEIRFFTAVPYILEIVAGSADGKAFLKSVHLVGTGGASLSQKSGDELVELGVRLLSRYGSAECGFILSSKRDYEVDKDWKYLRAYPSPALQFVELENDLAELILTKDWPFLAKSNIDDGGYATSDVFKRHDAKPGLWAYNSRNDAQIALSTGKKFDPSPIEASLKDVLAGLNYVRDLYIFGAGRPHPGLLVLPTQTAPSDSEIINKVWSIIQVASPHIPPHAQIKHHMVVVTDRNSPPLQKSSKGTIIRRQVEEDYSETILQAYRRQPVKRNDGEPLDVHQISGNVRGIVRESMIGAAIGDISDNEDLYTLGADSTVCMEICEKLQQEYGQVLGYDFPLTIVYDCGSVGALTRHIYDLYMGAGATAGNANEQMEQLARNMGHRWWRQDSSDETRPPKDRGGANTSQSVEDNREVVILTGATGTLGIWILNLLRTSDQIREIHCLTRGASEHAARERISKALHQKQLPPIENSIPAIFVHTCKLSEESLGLSPEVYNSLSPKASIIIHAAWSVNFNLPLKGFTADLKTLNNLLQLSASSSRTEPPSFLFCSSVASVLGSKKSISIPERLDPDPAAASSVGYGRSKWVAEQICHAADQHNKRLRGRVAILRIGQLCGDGYAGVWNVTEAWPLMLSSSTVTEALPKLKETLNWLKVDVAAAAVVEIAMNLAQGTRDKRERESNSHEIGANPGHQTCEEHNEEPGLGVYHVINNQQTPRWDDLLAWIKKRKPEIEPLPPAEWVARLEHLEGAARDHPARKLLGLWKAAYCSPAGAEEGTEPSFEMEKTLHVAPILGKVLPLDEAYFEKIWAWIEREMS